MTGETGVTGVLVFPVFPVFPVFLVFPLGRLGRPFSLPLLVAKVAQKPRTTSLAEARVAKPKTNATRVKRLPSLFLNGFATLASRDRLSRSLTRRRCEVRVLGAPLAQVLKKIPANSRKDRSDKRDKSDGSGRSDKKNRRNRRNRNHCTSYLSCSSYSSCFSCLSSRERRACGGGSLKSKNA